MCFNYERIKIIETKTNWLAGVEMIPVVTTSKLQPKNGNMKTENVNTLHEIFGHVREDATRLTAEYYGIKLRGTLDPCEDCARAKARQRNLGHGNESKKNENPGERLGFDLSSVKTESLGGSKYWLLVVDHATDHAWSFFLKSKSLVPETMWKFVNELKSKKYRVKYLRCDNAGENKATEAFSKKRAHLWSSSTRHRIHHNTMAKWNENLRLSMDEFVQC